MYVHDMPVASPPFLQSVKITYKVDEIDGSSHDGTPGFWRPEIHGE